MSCLPRFVILDQPQHLILRGNNRAEIFCVDAEYNFYLKKLKLSCDKHECSVHAYVLMTQPCTFAHYTTLEQSLGIPKIKKLT